MSRNATIVSQFSQQFKNFQKLVSPHLGVPVEFHRNQDNFNNKVASDFVRFYPDKNTFVTKEVSTPYTHFGNIDRKIFDSIGFAFDYEDCEEPLIYVTRMKQGGLTSSTPYKRGEFRVAFNRLIRNLENMNFKKTSDLIEFISAEMIKNTLDHKNIDIKSLENKIKESTKETNTALHRSEKKLAKLEQDSITCNSNAKAALQSSEEQLMVDSLSRRLKKAQKKLRTKRKELEDEHGVTRHKDLIKQEKMKILSLSSEKSKIEKDILNTVPPRVRRMYNML